MMAEINAKFSVTGISETWLQDISHTVDIDGYNFVHNHWSDRTGGGVGLYLTSGLVYKTRNDLKLLDQQCAESFFIEICRPKEKNVIVGIIYRPPHQNPRDFISDLEHLLSKNLKGKQTMLYFRWLQSKLNEPQLSSTYKWISGSNVLKHAFSFNIAPYKNNF